MYFGSWEERRGNLICRHCIEPCHIYTLDKEVLVYDESKVAEIKNYFEVKVENRNTWVSTHVLFALIGDLKGQNLPGNGSQKAGQAAIYETNFWPQIPINW